MPKNITILTLSLY